MRTSKDRIRHMFLFEFIGLCLVAPCVSMITGAGLEKTASLSVASSLLAMVWNYVYNLGFDHALVALGRDVSYRPPSLRTLHSLLFEAGLMLAICPMNSWWLKISLQEAFMLSIGVSMFFMAYAYVFNWGYDKVFPIPVATRQ